MKINTDPSTQEGLCKSNSFWSTGLMTIREIQFTPRLFLYIGLEDCGFFWESVAEIECFSCKLRVQVSLVTKEM